MNCNDIKNPDSGKTSVRKQYHTYLRIVFIRKYMFSSSCSRVILPAFSQADFLLSIIGSCLQTSFFKSFSYFESGGCVICGGFAAFVILYFLAAARKYCNTRISEKLTSFLFLYIRAHIWIPFKYGNSFNICIWYLFAVFLYYK